MPDYRKWMGGHGSDLLPIAIILGYWLACSILWKVTGLPNITMTAMLTNAILIIAGLSLCAFAYIVVRLVRVRPSSPITFIVADWQEHSMGQRLGRSLPLFVALTIFMPIFSAMKKSVGYYTYFSWDASFTQADIWLHGGDAWRLLGPLLAAPILLSGITVLYHVWLSLLYIGLPLIVLDHTRPQLRSQFILATILGWMIIGNGLAIAFASVGPCFLYPIHSDPHFLPLMRALEAADRHYPVLTLDVQHKLMLMQRAAGNKLGAGISAMPSVHVHFALLFALWGARVSRRTGAVFGLFFLCILVGSVATGYHYAVDGYVAMAATAAIWWLSGWIVRRHKAADDHEIPHAASAPGLARV